jgi:hypothetical protein
MYYINKHEEISLRKNKEKQMEYNLRLIGTELAKGIAALLYKHGKAQLPKPGKPYIVHLHVELSLNPDGTVNARLIADPKPKSGFDNFFNI